MDFAELRDRMVQEQLVRRGIKDARVLEAMRSVPREWFVPEPIRPMAYEDCPQPIGEGQTISQPYMVGLMTELLELRGGERVLEVGTGSGYQAAILAALGCKVYSVERRAALAELARQTLAELGYGGVQIKVGDGTLGWPDEAPFERIIVTAAAPRIPAALRSQLADGGLLAIPVGSQFSQELVMVRREGSKFREEYAGACVFVKLIGEDGWHSD